MSSFRINGLDILTLKEINWHFCVIGFPVCCYIYLLIVKSENISLIAGIS